MLKLNIKSPHFVESTRSRRAETNCCTDGMLTLHYVEGPWWATFWKHRVFRIGINNTIWDFETHYDEGNKKERRLATFLYGMFLKCPCTKGLVSTLALLEQIIDKIYIVRDIS